MYGDIRVAGQEFRHFDETVAPVKIVGIDDGKRFVDVFARRKYGMAGTPGFGPFGNRADARVIEIGRLESIFHPDMRGQFAVEYFLEVGLDFLADDEHHLAEAGPYRVIYRIIQDRLSARAECIYLFYASVTAAHTGSQNNQSRFHVQ